MAGTRIKEKPMKSALKLPPIKHFKADTDIKLEKVFDLMRNAKNVITFMRDEAGEFRFLYTEFGEEEFLTLAILMNRHIEVHDFFKLVMLDIENYRKAPDHDDQFTYKVLEYIKIKQKKHAILNI